MILPSVQDLTKITVLDRQEQCTILEVISLFPVCAAVTRSQSCGVDILQDASGNKDELPVMEGIETITSNDSAIRSRPKFGT
ncbi:Serine/Threonine-Protein Kinase Tao1 [Manis pentadactyla]|nr:Serine/Threonine-Protein Kinase Tao1 [Manis pentadactyla]